MIKARVVRRFTLNGTIDAHDPVGVTLRVTGGVRPFRVTFITVNWGRGYDPGEFKANVLRVLERTDEAQYVVLFIQELDEDDSGAEHRVFRQEMEKGTTLVGWATHEPIAVSPGVEVTRKRKAKLMGSGVEIGAPVGTGPVRWLVSCVIEIHGVRIGLANQHPHRDLPNQKVQKARRNGEQVTKRVVGGDLVAVCDLVVDAGDFNDTTPAKAHPKQRTLHKRGFDHIRIIAA